MRSKHNKRDKNKPLVAPLRSGASESVLASLYRAILFNLNMDIPKFTRLTDQYIIRAGIPYNSKESTSVRGNLKKELLGDRMSWKVFMKGLVFLNVNKFKLTVELHHNNNTITKHEKTIVLDNENLEGAEND